MSDSTVSFRMTLSDLEWRSEIFSDTKHLARPICDSWASCITLYPAVQSASVSGCLSVTCWYWVKINDRRIMRLTHHRVQPMDSSSLIPTFIRATLRWLQTRLVIGKTAKFWITWEQYLNLLQQMWQSLLFIYVSWTIIGQPRNSVFICRV